MSNSATTHKPDRKATGDGHRTGSPWSQNLGASIVVALISVPLSIGIAIAAGVPPERGLVTAILGGLIVGALGGNKLMISGPSAGPAVMVYELVGAFGVASLGIALPVMGCLHVLAGWFRFGRWFRAVSPAVIHAMLAGIGVLILAGQFHVLFDTTAKGSGFANITAMPATLTAHLWPLTGSQEQLAALIGLLTVGSMVFLSLVKVPGLRKIPPSLVAVVVATTVANFFAFPIDKVQLPPSLTDAVVFPQFDQVRLLGDPQFLAEIFALAFVASAETMLCSSAVDGMHNGKRTDYDRDLVALGVGNIACGVLGAPPTTGVISRSSANVQAGATDRHSSLLAGAWLLALMLIAPGALQVIPKSCLAGVLIWIGFNLVRNRPYAELLQFGKSEIVIFVITLSTIVGVNLLTGILTGLGLALCKLLFSLGQGFHRFDIDVEHDDEHDMTHVHLRGAASFIRLPALAAVLESLPPKREVHLHVEELDYIDHACIDAVTRWESQRIRNRVPVRVEWNYLHHKYHSNNHLDATPEEHAEAPDRTHTLLDFLTTDLVFINPPIETKYDAIGFLTNRILRHHNLDPAHEPLFETTIEREKQMSTVLGLGLMLPHGILRTTKSLHGAMAISETGWDFGAPDGQPVKCIVLLATPKESAAHHLAVLAAFARLFGKKPDLSQQIVNSPNSNDAMLLLQSTEAAEINYVFEKPTR